MTAESLIKKLTRKGISLMVDGDRLIWAAPKGSMTPELLVELRSHRGEVLAALTPEKEAHRPRSGRAAPGQTCSPHNDPANHVDAPAPGGRVRTTCRFCGRFLGYRPSEN
jgi:hypothetical protein